MAISEKGIDRAILKFFATHTDQRAAFRAAITAYLDVVDGKKPSDQIARDNLEERLFEAEKIIEERDGRLALVDRIADMVGLPHDQELDITAFQLWFDSAVK